MENRPVLKINGKRYKADRLTTGAYRQIIWLIDDIGQMEQAEFRDDMVFAIQTTFGLTNEQAELIPIDDVIPLFWQIASWAQGIFTKKAHELPNAESPETTPGQS